MFFFLRDNKSKRKAILIFFLQKLCRDVIVEKKKKEIHKAGIFTRNLRGTPWRNIVIRNSMVYKVLR